MLCAVPYDALVVLGCRVRSGRPTPTAQRRVERAARAYWEEGAEVVITAGGKSWDGFRECDVFAAALQERGVPSAALRRERDSLTTRGNAEGVRRLLGHDWVKKLGLVTCDWHMPRALWLFRRAGFDPIPVPATTPPGPWYAVAIRSLRERGSMVIDSLGPIRRSA